MILDEKMFTEWDRTQKRGSYKKREVEVDLPSLIYDKLEELGFNVYASRETDGFEISRKNPENLEKAKRLLNRYNVDYAEKPFRDRTYLVISFSPEDIKPVTKPSYSELALAESNKCKTEGARPLYTDLSKISGSMTKILHDNSKDLMAEESPRALYNKLKALFDKNNLNTTASNRLLDSIAEKENIIDAQYAVLNSALYGSGNKVININDRKKPKEFNENLEKQDEIFMYEPIKFFNKDCWGSELLINESEFKRLKDAVNFALEKDYDEVTAYTYKIADGKIESLPSYSQTAWKKEEGLLDGWEDEYDKDYEENLLEATYDLDDEYLDDEDLRTLQAVQAKIAQRKQRRDQEIADLAKKDEMIKNGPTVKKVIEIIRSNISIDDKIQKLFNELVPNEGNAKSTAGELIRAMMKLLYRAYNSGDVFYEGYGIETCGSAVTFIVDKFENLYDQFERIAVRGLTDEEYTQALYDISRKLLRKIEGEPFLIIDNVNEDMHDWDDSVAREFEPKYEESYEIPLRIQEHIEVGNIGDIESELEYWEEFKGVNISIQNNTVYFENMTEYQYNEIDRNWFRWMDSWADDLDEEFGKPEEEIDEDYEDLEESKQSGVRAKKGCNIEESYGRKWSPSKTARREFAQKMDDIEKFVNDHGISMSKNGDSYYFSLNGKNYRVSNHSVEKSDSGAFKVDQDTGETVKVRDKYHGGRQDDTIYIHAGKTRIKDIYNDILAGKKLDGRGYPIHESLTEDSENIESFEADKKAEAVRNAKELKDSVKGFYKDEIVEESIRNLELAIKEEEKLKGTDYNHEYVSALKSALDGAKRALVSSKRKDSASMSDATGDGEKYFLVFSPRNRTFFVATQSKHGSLSWKGFARLVGTDENDVKVSSRMSATPEAARRTVGWLNIRGFSEIKDSMTVKATIDEYMARRLTEDSENIESLETPMHGPDSGIAAVLNSLIIDEWEAIDAYNSAIVNAELEGKSDIAKILRDIVAEENLHVGQLQVALETVSPNTVNIEAGKEEAEEQIDDTQEVLQNN